MKESYEELEMRIIVINAEDIITTSGCIGDTSCPNELPDVN